jgi:hypothetical protein
MVRPSAEHSPYFTMHGPAECGDGAGYLVGHGLAEFQDFHVYRDPRSDPVRGGWTYLVSRGLAEC